MKDNILSMLFLALLLAALVSTVYVSYRVASVLPDAMIATGHYTDLRPTATYEAERGVLAKYGIDIDEVSAR